MRSVGMGAMPEDGAGKKLFRELAELKAENAALKRELAELKPKKVAKKGKAEAAAVDDTTAE